MSFPEFAKVARPGRAVKNVLKYVRDSCFSLRAEFKDAGPLVSRPIRAEREWSEGKDEGSIVASTTQRMKKLTSRTAG